MCTVLVRGETHHGVGYKKTESGFFIAIVEVPCLHDGIYDDCCGVRFEPGSDYAVYTFEKDDQSHKPMLGYS